MAPLIPSNAVAALAALEDAGLNASATPETLLLDGWLLRFCRAKAKRSRCVNALAAGHRPIADRLTQVKALYAQHQLPLFVRITPFVPIGLDEQLAALGLHRIDDTRVMQCMALPLLAPAMHAVDAQLELVDSAEYCEIVGGLRSSQAAERQAHARRLAASPVAYQGYVLRTTAGQVLACAQAAREGTLVGLYDVFTAPQARGQGLSQALCGQVLGLAAKAGAQSAYLQVESDNLPARSVYHRLGFTDAYGYHYRTDAAA